MENRARNRNKERKMKLKRKNETDPGCYNMTKTVFTVKTVEL